MQLASCIGTQFDLETLSIVADQTPTDAATNLWPALQVGLISPQSELYKFYLEISTTPQQKTSDAMLSYKFLHDRVQQAAYSLINPGETTAVHLKIGRQLRDKISDHEWDTQIFNIVNHLNRGMSLIEHPQEREHLAQLNQQAGAYAKKSAAYTAAMDYLKTGLSLLTPQCWEHQYELCFQIHYLAAEMAYLLGDSTYLNQMMGAGLQSARSQIDRSKFHEVQILNLISQNQFREAALYGIKALLSCWGIRISENPSQLQIKLELFATLGRMIGKSPQSLLTLPPMSNPEKLAICRLLSVIGSAANNGLPEILPIITFRAVALNLAYGNSPSAAVPYTILAFIFCEKLGKIDAGYELGKMAIALCHRTNSKTTMVKTLFLWHYFISYRKESLRDALPLLLETYQMGLEVGDQEYAAYCLVAYFGYAQGTGCNLADLSQEIVMTRPAVKRLNQGNMTLLHSLYCQLLENLTTAKDDVCELTGNFLDEKDVTDSRNLLTLNVEKLMLSVFFQRYTDVRKYLELAEQLSSYVEGTFIAVEIVFYGTLVRLQQYINQSIPTQKTDLKQIKAARKRFKTLAASAPMNFSHHQLLLEAEYQRVFGQPSQASDDYDLAIAKAKDNGYSQQEALANEFAAMFYLGRANKHSFRLHARSLLLLFPLGGYRKGGRFRNPLSWVTASYFAIANFIKGNVDYPDDLCCPDNLNSYQHKPQFQ